MIQLINRRNALRTGLLASGGLAVLSQLGKAASPLTTSKEETNKAIVGRWFTDFWRKTCNLHRLTSSAASARGAIQVNESLGRLWAETARASKPDH